MPTLACKVVNNAGISHSSLEEHRGAVGLIEHIPLPRTSAAMQGVLARLPMVAWNF